ncbi:glycoside hydrolase family 3 C-terminal domain-containing protein [Candidatus Poriferisodalis sp.]|uniref:glycoside hydrolase family 3 C-terminal domain-containing protein n=1 Tax=Candidatus Poriferisodalis sp. TaxID=3101277 RepID=UPI003C6EF449
MLTEVLRDDWGWNGLVVTDLIMGLRDPVAGLPLGGDRGSLRLHPGDEQLIADARAACDRVIVAVMSGGAVVMPWLDSVAATLMVWYPGSEGGNALADVLLGQAEPGGRLPFAVPRDERELTDFDPEAETATYGLLHGQWHLDAKSTPAHLPFGHGLGYTAFELGDARLDGDEVIATVRNTGLRPGSAVVQVYGSVPDSVHERPAKRLVGFAKERIAPGTASNMRVRIDRSLLDLRIDGEWHREDLPIEFSVGFDAATARRLST